MGAATVAGVMLPLLVQALVRWAMARRIVTRDRWRLWIPIGGSIAVATAWQVPARRRAAVLGAGLAAVYLVVALGVFGYFHWIGPRSDQTHLRIDAVDPASPAHGALRPGDRIVEMNGRPLEAQVPLAKLVDDAGAVPLAIAIERSGRRQIATVTPRYDEESGHHRLGIQLVPERVRRPMAAGAAAGRASVFPFSHGRIVVDYVWKSLTAHEEEEAAFYGPVGISALKADPPAAGEIGVVYAVCLFLLLLAADLVLLLVIALRRRR